MEPWESEMAVLLNAHMFLQVCNKKIDASKLEGIQDLSFDLPKLRTKEKNMKKQELSESMRDVYIISERISAISDSIAECIENEEDSSLELLYEWYNLLKSRIEKLKNNKE
jgi:hypothetical protein